MIQPTLALLGSASFTPRNRLLAALPHDVLSSLRPHLKPVSLPRGRVLCEADEPLERAYFVEVGAVSLVTVFENGTTAEMATVGREGMVGIGILLGGGHALGRLRGTGVRLRPRDRDLSAAQRIAREPGAPRRL